jgi:hypothetical protein
MLERSLCGGSEFFRRFHSKQPNVEAGTGKIRGQRPGWRYACRKRQGQVLDSMTYTYDSLDLIARYLERLLPKE